MPLQIPLWFFFIQFTLLAPALRGLEQLLQEFVPFTFLSSLAMPVPSVFALFPDVVLAGSCAALDAELTCHPELLHTWSVLPISLKPVSTHKAC